MKAARSEKTILKIKLNGGYMYDVENETPISEIFREIQYLFFLKRWNIEETNVRCIK